MITVEIPIRRGRRGARVVLDAEAVAPQAPRVPVVARTLALAHKMQAIVDRGEVADQAELARVFGFTRARVSQIMDLTLLAPDIQEQVLFVAETAGRDRFRERDLRVVVRSTSWADQRRRWEQLAGQPDTSASSAAGSCR